MLSVLLAIAVVGVQQAEIEVTPLPPRVIEGYSPAPVVAPSVVNPDSQPTPAPPVSKEKPSGQPLYGQSTVINGETWVWSAKDGGYIKSHSVVVQSQPRRQPVRNVISGIGAAARYRWHNDHVFPDRIDPRAQAWAQREANLIASRGYRGYLRNGHPGGACPYGSVTGSGMMIGGELHTCEGDRGMKCIAKAVAQGDRLYAVRVFAY